jgi:hypothetical protein
MAATSGSTTTASLGTNVDPQMMLTLMSVARPTFRDAHDAVIFGMLLTYHINQKKIKMEPFLAGCLCLLIIDRLIAWWLVI